MYIELNSGKLIPISNVSVVESDGQGGSILTLSSGTYSQALVKGRAPKELLDSLVPESEAYKTLASSLFKSIEDVNYKLKELADTVNSTKEELKKEQAVVKRTLESTLKDLTSSLSQIDRMVVRGKSATQEFSKFTKDITEALKYVEEISNIQDS